MDQVNRLGDKIMGNYNKHLMALGLQHGATQEEIHAAFQRMSVKYHPDNDSSLDAEMKFHEARQAYAALTKPAEPSFTPPKPPNATRSQTSEPPPNSRTREQASGFSGSTDGARQQTTHDNNFTGAHAGARQQATHDQNFTNFTNPFSGAKKDTVNSGGPNGSITYDPVHGVVGKFSDFPLHDYFFRLKLVLAVIASIAAIFFAMSNLTMLTFTDESSARLFRHTTVFVLAAWAIFWYIRFTNPSRRLSLFVIFVLGGVYACWISFYALWPEFWYLLRYSTGQVGQRAVDQPLWYTAIFALIFTLAAFSLEKEGLRGFLSDFYNTRA